MKDAMPNATDVGREGSGAGDRVPVIPGVEDLHQIGRGGFGVVYRGHQSDLARDVAVKVVTSPAAQGSAVERWRKEIAAMGRLSNHPNIVTVYSGGLTEDGLPYLVMPYVPGGSLHDRMTTDGPLPVSEVAELGSKLAGALAAAHAVGVLHRDVKPDNVLLSPYGEPQLTDFGIARLLDTTTTATGTVHATIRYAAPEVLSGQPATELADVYGLGATLYACLTGAAPFADADDESIVALVGRIATERPTGLRRLDVPSELAEVIEGALAKAPADRIASAEEMERLLDSAAGSLTPRAAADTTAAARTVATPAPAPAHERTAAVPVVETAPMPEFDPAATVAAPRERERKREPRRPPATRPRPARQWGLLVALGVLVTGLAALLLVVTRDSEEPSGDASGSASSPTESAPATLENGATPTARGDVSEALSSRALAYVDAIRDGRLGTSYGMLSPAFRRAQSRAEYEEYWRGRAVAIVGDVTVDENALAATVPVTVDGRREDYRLIFIRGEDGTWYVDAPRPG